MFFQIFKKIFTIRYEDLVARQLETIQNVCKFLDLPFDPGMLDIKTNTTAYQEEMGLKGITALSVDRWKKKIKCNKNQYRSDLCPAPNAYVVLCTLTDFSSRLSLAAYLLGNECI